MHVPDYGTGGGNLRKNGIFAQLMSLQAEIEEAKVAGICSVELLEREQHRVPEFTEGVPVSLYETVTCDKPP